MRFPSLSVRVAFGLALGLGLTFSALTVRAQDRLIFKDNHVQQGKVTGMSGNTVMINLNTASGAAGQIGFDLRLLTRVEVAPPPAFHVGMAAYAAGEWDKALADLKPIAEQFRGLPTPWAQQTFATLGDLYVEKSDLVHAEEAYNDFRRLYPAAGGNSLRYDLGQARIAFARNDAVKAQQQLEPIARLALRNPTDASRADAAAYGQAFCLLGQLQERAGHPAEALEDYLRTVTLSTRTPPAPPAPRRVPTAFVPPTKTSPRLDLFVGSR